MIEPRNTFAVRSATAAVFVLAALSLLGGCTAGSTTATASMESGERPARISELAPSGPGTLPEVPGLPDLPELPDIADLPDMPDFRGDAECAELMSAFTELTILGVMPGGEDRADSLSQQLRDTLPAGLQDDLDTVLGLVDQARSAGLLESAELLMSEEFITATTPIFDWIVQGCPGAVLD